MVENEPISSQETIVPEDQLKILNKVMNDLLGNVAQTFLPKVMEAKDNMDEFIKSIIDSDLMNKPKEEHSAQLELQSDEETEDEVEEDYNLDTIYVIRENGESIGFFYLEKEAYEFVEQRFQQFMADHSDEYLRTARDRGMYIVHRKTPYLWFLYSEQCILNLYIEEVREIVGNEIDDTIYEEESDSEEEVD